MDYSPWSEKEVLPNFNFETGEATPTKIGVHAFDINPYLHEFFEVDSDRLNFLMTMDYSPWSEREIWPKLKSSNISEIRDVTPTKTGMVKQLHYTVMIIMTLATATVVLYFTEL